MGRLCLAVWKRRTERYFEVTPWTGFNVTPPKFIIVQGIMGGGAESGTSSLEVLEEEYNIVVLL